MTEDQIAKIIFGVVAASPGVYAVITRHKALVERTTASRINMLLEAQGKQLDNCNQRCSRLETEVRETWEAYRKEISALRQDHLAEIAAFQAKHRSEIEDWQHRYQALEAAEREHSERLEYLERLLRGAGLLPGRGGDGHQ